MLTHYDEKWGENAIGTIPFYPQTVDEILSMVLANKEILTSRNKRNYAKGFSWD
jgi:hypothetical protein